MNTLSSKQKVFYQTDSAAVRALQISRLFKKQQQLFVITSNRTSAEELYTNLVFFLKPEQVHILPDWEVLPFEPVSPQTHITASRLHILNLISKAKRPFVVIASAEASMHRLLPADLIEPLSFELKTADSIPRDELLEKFINAGYQRVTLVEETGDLAVRGAVIDFFPAETEEGIRLEFLGDSLRKIRSFEPDTQRSLSELKAVKVLPVREKLSFSETGKHHSLLEDAVTKIKTRSKKLETPPRETAKALSAAREGIDYPGIELVSFIAAPGTETVFSRLSPDTLLVIDDDISLENHIAAFQGIIEEREERFIGNNYLIPERETIYLSREGLKEALSEFRQVVFHSLRVVDSIHPDQDHPPSLKLRGTRDQDQDQDQEVIRIRSEGNLEISTRLQAEIGTGKVFKTLANFIESWRKQDYSIAFVAGSTGRIERLKRELLNFSLEARVPAQTGINWIETENRFPLVILRGHLSEGFSLPDKKIIVISENEIFAKRSYRKHKEKSERTLKKLLGSILNLNNGDYVVHEDYGIGVYQGLIHLTVAGTESDFLHIEYADSKLYLPVQNIGKIQKYSAAEGQKPTVDKLSSKRWQKTKAKVKEAVNVLAGDLIKLYAARSVAEGLQFSPENAEDEIFADDFPYDETPDQLSAIKDTLSDMASERPMDRLVCGDVGFGKTEVALRAAYKSVQHSKQVAILAPTTILAEQHYKSFKERLNNYPVKVGVVSRFHQPKDNKKVLEGLSEGKVDIIIGTHRILSRDVLFSDLGLLIIDEEQRFGVGQKEKIKQMRRKIEVLTLTATPIPRTLYMSLLNIRDISVINTPPADRRAIQTYIATRNENIIRDALLRERQRGGQSFFVHNRVQTIPAVTSALEELVPECRFEFGHGQMKERQLEKIMERFILGHTDVLVCTTIIESGVDIPNANTMIVDRADMFGLAQLYQMRGRVGRSNRQAYAYLLTPPTRRIGEEAQKRMAALQSLDDLGRGFNLALRDLEIRGAGNLLGKEQSGHVMTIGYELYMKILKEAVLHLKGEEPDLEDIIDPEIKLGINAYIPENYIPDISERLVLYQRLSSAGNEQECEDLRDEIIDRFGPLNREIENYLEMMKLRALLRHFGIVKAEYKKPALVLALSPRADADIHRIVSLAKENPGTYRFGKSLTLTVTMSANREYRIEEFYSYIKELTELIRKR